MIPRSPKTEGRDRSGRAAPPSSTPKTVTRTAEKGRRHLLGEALRGLCFAGMGLLLGSCPAPLGTAPAGIALVAASSSYTWWIAGGAVLGGFLRPQHLHAWAWVGVYAFLLILRLCIRFFVDPPSHPDGRPLRAGVYLSLCMASFRRNIGLSDPTDASVSGRSCNFSGGQPFPNCRAPEMQLFGEHPFLRMLTAVATGFLAGLLGMLAGGFHVYDLLGTLFLIFACPALTFALVAVFGEAGLHLLFSPAPMDCLPPRNLPRATSAARRRQSTRSRQLDGGLTTHFHPLPLFSTLCLVGLTVFAARGLRLPPALPYLQVDVSLLLALLISLFATARLGAVAGVATSVVAGLCHSPRLAPVLILAAGGFALLRVLSSRAGLLGGCTIGSVWCASVEGMPTLVTHLPTLLLTIPVYLVLERLSAAFPLTEAEAHTDRELEGFTASVTAALAAENRAAAQRTRLSALSDALAFLSRRFSDLSVQLRKPKASELRLLCEEALETRCSRCRHLEACLGREEGRMTEVAAKLAEALAHRSRVTADDFPAAFFSFCGNAEELVADINRRYAHLQEALARGERTDVFAADYAAMASLLGDALDADLAEAEAVAANRAVADRLFECLSARGMDLHGVAVTGREESRRRRVILQGRALPESGDIIEEIRALLEEVCDASFLSPTVEKAAGGDTVLTFAPRARLAASYAGSTVPAGHAKRAPLPAALTDQSVGTYTPPAVCGDHIALFHHDEGYFYALISDGMGSGEAASLTSDICVTFLEKMLAAGGHAEVSLGMLDTYLHAKNIGTGEECSATVDLMELDLMDGHAVFAKNGAAPTYVVRDGTVYKLRSRSLPLGILRKTEPEMLRFRTDPGDVVVMVSDGVTRGQDECPWLIDLLSSPIPRNMDELRRDIIRRALSAGSEDDLSAIAIRVDRT